MTRTLKILITCIVIIGVLFIVILFSGVGWSFYDSNSTKMLAKRKLTKNIEEAKQRNVFVKHLQYKMDSNMKFEFNPYIEKAFRYGKDSTETLPFFNTDYPYRLGFQKRVEELYIFIQDNDMDKFDSANGLDFADGSGFLRTTQLQDTLLLGVSKDSKVIGSIKVWN